ncbi:SET domain-containing protein [Aaosphaeria arxii CBS 175.79]|uniref:SET domain-containing protein n=1 Tax=Aaosphaeria arxii CBS 175.79 TaxID=1450172 RepID=A0A6A5X9Y2_9PLEO|nr:SET domain-containing protein [Aaosphaeria arxii CBS 175.79]KAF2009865.1 SET domain-containing protein [Aaosphaeria arxii CBS 175.79]
MAQRPNENVYFARSPICDAASSGSGKGLFANRAFAPGDAISVIERPLGTSLDVSRLEDTCSNCFLWTTMPHADHGEALGARLYVPEDARVDVCTGCRSVRYCGKKCQTAAWKRGHKYECKVLKSINSMPGRSLPKAVFAIIDMLSRRKNGLIDDRTWAMLCELDGHVDHFRMSEVWSDIELMATGALHYSGTGNTFDRDFVISMLGRVLANSLTIITPSLDPMGIMIDPHLCRINHSCDPNAFIMMDGPQVSIRPLREIKKDEEVLISYCDTTLPYARRQLDLQTRWFFTCKCSKCKLGTTAPEDEWKTPPKDLAPEWKAKAKEMSGRQALLDDPANYVGPSADEKHVAVLQGKAFECHREAQLQERFPDSLRILKEGMSICSQTKLWPIHRQPYPSLRDDCIYALLELQKYREAFTQSFVRYRYVMPKLQRTSFHPARVTQTWSTAMLAFYFSQEAPIIPGVEMPLVALMLMRETAGLCEKSHGGKNTFTISVKKKLREVESALCAVLGVDDPTIITTEGSEQMDILEEKIPFNDDLDVGLEAIVR